MKKAAFLFAVCLGALCGPILSGAGAEVMQIKTNRALNLGTVRLLDADAPWFVLQETFVSNFSKSLGGPEGKAMPVRALGLSGSAASDKLLNGECDAVLVLGDRLPHALTGAKFNSTRAVSEIGSPVYTFYLVTRADDSGAKTILIPAFEQATASSEFQEAVGRVSTMYVVAHSR